MEEQNKRSLFILNLSGTLAPELESYFQNKSVEIYTSESEPQEWTHIIVDENQDFDALEKEYNISSKGIKLIALGKVNKLKEFVAHNGKLIFNELWLGSAIGSFILDKFFQEFAGVGLTDNYPSFQEKGSFNIANPFATGEYLDRLVYHAFESEMSGLSIKTFFDHFIMYLAGLKHAGKVGLPIEVSYGTYDDVFGVQLNFLNQGLELRDVTSSLTSSITKVPEEYLLNVAIQSSDFFDFTYLSEVNKIVATAIWTKDKKITLENRGLMFTQISSSSSPLIAIPTEGESSFLIQNATTEDMSEKIQMIEDETETIADRISDGLEDEEIDHIISGGMEKETFNQIVGGMIEETVEDKIITGTKEDLDEAITLVKGKIEEEKQAIHRVAGEKFDVDNFAFRIAASVGDSVKDEDKMTVKFLGTGLKDNLKSGLFDFANKINKSIDDLSEVDMDNFKEREVPAIVKKQIIRVQNQSLADKIKMELDQKIQDKEIVVGEIDKVRELLRVTVKESMGSSKADLFEEDKNANKEIEKKYAEAMMEMSRLKSQVKALTSEVRIQKESKAMMAEAHARAAEAAKADTTSPLVNAIQKSEAGKAQLLQQIAARSGGNDADVKRLQTLLEKDKQMMEMMRQEEIKGKKAQIEAAQKETFYSLELEKSQREIKNKELMLIKTKEIMTKMVEKKDIEVNDLKMKLDQTGKLLNSGNTQAITLQLRDVEKQNQNNLKMIEMYKNKVTTLTASLESNKNDDGNYKEESRKLQMANTQLKNQLDLSKREIDKLLSKNSADTAMLNALKAEKIKLDQLLKKAATETPKEQNNTHQIELELKKSVAQGQVLENQLKDAVTKVKDLEMRLVEASKPQQKALAGNDDASKGKVLQLETTVKKLTQDLVESRNQTAEMKKESNKLRQEKTALQNQLDTMKRNQEKADKASGAAGKKSGGKAA